MGAIEIAGLLRDYGMVGALALALLVIGIITRWWRESMNQRLADKDAIQERLATALERGSSTGQEHTEAIKELRDGQAAILKTVTEAALTGAAKDTAIITALGEVRAAVDRKSGGRA